MLYIILPKLKLHQSYTSTKMKPSNLSSCKVSLSTAICSSAAFCK